MSVIVTLIRTPARLERLRAAVRDAHHLIVCEDWSEVFAACDRQVVNVAVLELDIVAVPNFDSVRQLKRLAPRLALVAYASLGVDRIHHIFDAGRYGFEELVVADMGDGPTAFSRALERASARGVAGMVRTEIPADADPLVRDTLLVAVTRAHERLTPAALADIVGASPRRLARALADAGYPSPHRLVMWGRLIVAAGQMDETRRSADRIALALGFPSGSAFRNNCRRYLDARPGEIRTRGGARFVLERLTREIALANT